MWSIPIFRIWPLLLPIRGYIPETITCLLQSHPCSSVLVLSDLLIIALFSESNKGFSRRSLRALRLENNAEQSHLLKARMTVCHCRSGMVSGFHRGQNLHAGGIKFASAIGCGCLVIATKLGCVAGRAQVDDFVAVEGHAHTVGPVDVETTA